MTILILVCFAPLLRALPRKITHTISRPTQVRGSLEGLQPFIPPLTVNDGGPVIIFFSLEHQAPPWRVFFFFGAVCKVRSAAMADGSRHYALPTRHCTTSCIEQAKHE